MKFWRSRTPRDEASVAVSAPKDMVDLFAPLIGSRLELLIRDRPFWVAAFDCGFRTSIQCRWRVIAKGAIRVTDGDDGHPFGLPAPVDAAAVAVEAIGKAKVSAVRLDPETADLWIAFGNRVRLEIWNNSGGYEGWTADLPLGEGKASLVAMGGGQVAVWRP